MTLLEASAHEGRVFWDPLQIHSPPEQCFRWSLQSPRYLENKALAEADDEWGRVLWYSVGLEFLTYDRFEWVETDSEKIARLGK
jgi:hypothetical protein